MEMERAGSVPGDLGLSLRRPFQSEDFGEEARVGWSLPAVKVLTLMLHPEEELVHGDPSGDTSGVPWFGSQLTERTS